MHIVLYMYTYSIKVFRAIYSSTNLIRILIWYVYVYFSQKGKKEIREKNGQLEWDWDQTLLSRTKISCSHVKHTDMWKLCNRSYILFFSENSIIIANLTFVSCHIKCSISMTLNTTCLKASPFSREASISAASFTDNSSSLDQYVANGEGSLVLRSSVHQVSTSSMCLPSSYSTLVRWTYDE